MTTTGTEATTSKPAIGSSGSPAPAAVAPGPHLVEEVAGVLGRDEDAEPAVGDLAREAQVPRPDRREVDRQVAARRADGEPQRLARAVGQRQREVLPGVRAPGRGAAPSARSRRTRGCAPGAPRSAPRASPRSPGARRRRARGGTARRTTCRAWPPSSPSWRACAPGSASPRRRARSSWSAPRASRARSGRRSRRPRPPTPARSRGARPRAPARGCRCPVPCPRNRRRSPAAWRPR